MSQTVTVVLLCETCLLLSVTACDCRLLRAAHLLVLLVRDLVGHVAQLEQHDVQRVVGRGDDLGVVAVEHLQ